MRAFNLFAVSTAVSSIALASPGIVAPSAIIAVGYFARDRRDVAFCAFKSLVTMTFSKCKDPVPTTEYRTDRLCTVLAGESFKANTSSICTHPLAVAIALTLMFNACNRRGKSKVLHVRIVVEKSQMPASGLEILDKTGTAKMVWH
jgi:hypothetical protein